MSWDDVGGDVVYLQGDADGPGLSDDPMKTHGGGNSGFQACNLAVLLGAKRLVLLGFDMRTGENGESHWHGHHPAGLNNPGQSNFNGWIAHFSGAVQDFRQMGVEVINCTPGSALRCFPMARLEETL